MKKIVDNDFQNLSTNLENFIREGDKDNKLLPFRINQVVDDILNDTFKSLSEIAYSHGLQSLSYALEYFDEKIDDFEIHYDYKSKEFSNKTSDITIDDKKILNQNLAANIILQ